MLYPNPDDLMKKIIDEISELISIRKYGTQEDLAKILGVTQPRVSAIYKKKYSDFSLGVVMGYAVTLKLEQSGDTNL